MLNSRCNYFFTFYTIGTGPFIFCDFLISAYNYNKDCIVQQTFQRLNIFAIR